MTDVFQKLRQAWRCRIDQKHEQALTGYIEVASIIGLPFGNSFEKKYLVDLCSEKSPYDVVDAILLKSSLRRMQKSFDESCELVELCESIVSELGVDRTYRLFFEKGLNFFAIGDFTNALDCFLAAANKVKADDDYSTWERLCAEINSLLCFENLGIPATGIITKINASISSLGSNVSDGVLSQMEAFKLRGNFRRGEIKPLKLPDQTPLKANQSNYFKLWTACLPYHRNSLPQGDLSKKLAEFCIDQENSFFMRSFRLRTIQGIQHADDSSSFVKPSEWIDRLYLWTWNWLRDPDIWPLSKVMSLLEPLRSSDFNSRLTSEDQQLLVNGLSWLDLFDRQQDHGAFIKKWVGGFGSRSPIFELEYLCIAYLKARRDRNDQVAIDYWKQLSDHPLWTSEELYFRKLVEGAIGGSGADGEPETFGTLFENLGRLIGLSNNSSSVLTADFATFRVTNKKKPNGSTNSESICRAIELLKKYKVATKEHLLASCFGLRAYDVILHDQKIYNLLQRLNKVCNPYLKFKTKGGKVYGEGSWDRVNILNYQILSEQIVEHQQWKSLFDTNQKSIHQGAGLPKLGQKDLSIPSELSTKDLQHILGKSRATTNRMIIRWEKLKLVKRRGRARATTLLLSDELIKEISHIHHKNTYLNGDFHP